MIAHPNCISHKLIVLHRVINFCIAIHLWNHLGDLQMPIEDVHFTIELETWGIEVSDQAKQLVVLARTDPNMAVKYPAVR